MDVDEDLESSSTLRMHTEYLPRGVGRLRTRGRGIQTTFGQGYLESMKLMCVLLEASMMPTAGTLLTTARAIQTGTRNVSDPSINPRHTAHYLANGGTMGYVVTAVVNQAKDLEEGGTYEEESLSTSSK